MFIPFHYYDPKSFAEFLEIARQVKDYQILAGGTDLLVKMRGGYSPCQHVLDIKKIQDIPELKKIEKNQEGLSLGSLVTFTELLNYKEGKDFFPALYEASRVMGCYEIRNRATFGGNICNAASGAEAGSVFLIFNAVVHILGPQGKRSVLLEEFYQARSKTGKPGTILGPEEIVTHFFLPFLPGKNHSVYVRRARSAGMDLSSLNLSLAMFEENGKKNFRIAAGAIGPIPCRFREVEELLSGNDLDCSQIENAQKKLSDLSQPRPNSKRASVEYKKDQISQLLVVALNSI